MAESTAEGASSRILTAVHVSRFENVVTAVETTMVWDSPGEISQDSQRGLGVVLGLLAKLVNELASCTRRGISCSRVDRHEIPRRARHDTSVPVTTPD